MSVYQPAVLMSRGNGPIDAVAPMKWIEKGSCMRLRTLLNGLLKGKLLLMALVSLAVFGGAVAMAATTSGGQSVFHALVGSTSTTSAPDKPSPTHGTGGEATPTPGANSHAANCPGLPEAQNLAASFSLGTASTGDDIQAICSLHQGTFKGTAPSGATVASSQVFGYGEINDLLTYAQYLATHDTANAAGTLTSDNARSHLAEALQNCGTTALESCLLTKIPGFQPGKSGNNGNGNGKPTSAPTPGGGKPTSTPTPPGGGKPSSTRTPHSH